MSIKNIEIFIAAKIAEFLINANAIIYISID